MRTALAGELHGVEEGSLVDENNLLDDDFVVQAAGADDVRIGQMTQHLCRYISSTPCTVLGFKGDMGLLQDGVLEGIVGCLLARETFGHVKLSRGARGVWL